MSRELLKRALDALEYFESHSGYSDWHRETAGYIRAELEKPDIDDSLTAAFMLGYQSAKNDYGRNSGTTTENL